MDWAGYLKNLVGASKGKGRCIYAAVHCTKTGRCICYLPYDICPGASEEEVLDLVQCHREPLLLYSHGATISRLRYTFLKMEGRNTILLRRSDAKCAVGFANTVLVIAVYPINEPSLPVVQTLQEICTELIQECY